ncbi:thioredoxin reductase (NADPH) [Enteropsectra breve]|nr:thioredoxin reductase (NADPH) [Enteropsectra breve]
MEILDAVVIGSGPAACSAALAIMELKPWLFEGELIGGIGPGGQLTTTTDVDNYPGFPNGVDGPDLMDTMKKQLLDAGIKIVAETVTRLTKKEDIFEFESSSKKYMAKSVIIATGASAKRLYVPGTNEGEFWQNGISACAVCDGFFFRNKTVAVIGGGDSALEEALYMANIASKVYLIHRRHGFRAREDKMVKARNHDKIEIVTPAELVSANGHEKLEALTLRNSETEEKFTIEVNGLFFAIGHIPNGTFIADDIEKNENGYIITNERMHTSISGLFACGDVQDYFYKQAVTAAGTGLIAGKECMLYLEKK